jgi:uncharacterized repeat protein (TIGR03803 family)
MPGDCRRIDVLQLPGLSFRGLLHWLVWTLTLASTISVRANVVGFEAESGVIGSDFGVFSGPPTYISILTDTTANNPGSAARVASYSITFPAAGTYQLYGRVRVGPGGASDDSFFYGNGFGVKSLGTDGDWILVNSINIGGFTNASDVVSGSGSAGISVWKWINLSDYTGTAGETPVSFTVATGNLTQTFQIGGRENGLDVDKLAFGTSGASFTVAELNKVSPAGPPTNAFVGPDGIALHRFSPIINGINAEGGNPSAGLVWSSGVLCGTTLNGGLQGVGTVFYMSMDGSNFVASHSFNSSPDAGHPLGELSVAGNGFFGASFGGGSSGVGAVFVGQTNGTVSVIRNFSTVSEDNATNSGGASPTALLALSGGTLYGTTTAGGIGANGTVFSLNTNGTTLSVLHDFKVLDSQSGTNLDGALPWGGLILSGDTLYGTASAGGAGGSGVVFSVGTNGANFIILHSFTPMDTLTATNADGAMPVGGLVMSNSTFYGTTIAGGQGGRGTLFSLQTNGLGFTVLHHFSATDAATGTNTDGASPCAGLILSGTELLGTAASGGSGAAGTVFSLNLKTLQFTTLHSFTALADNGTNADGAFPVAPVLRLGNCLYGATFSGGPGAAGTVFSIPLAAPPAIITHVARNLDGSITLNFLGTPNSTNVVQAATSLMNLPAWQDVSTNVADVDGGWQFTSNTTASTQFFRSYAR